MLVKLSGKFLSIPDRHIGLSEMIAKLGLILV